MTLELPTTPSELESSVKYAISHISPEIPYNGADIALGSSEDLTPTLAHQVYTIPSDFLISGRILSSAIATGWRVIVLKDEQARFTIDFDEKLSRSSAIVNEGTLARTTIEAVEYAENKFRLTSGKFQIRSLVLPELYFSAVWFHSDPRDLLYVLDPIPRSFKSCHLYSSEEFSRIATELLQKRLLLASKMPAKPTQKVTTRSAGIADSRPRNKQKVN
jgi:hypothetical protein